MAFNDTITPANIDQVSGGSTNPVPAVAQPNPASLGGANPPAPTMLPEEAPHARLFNMLQGLGVALSAAGRAVATHGREGGAPDVAAFEAQKQEIELAQEREARAQHTEQRETQESASRIELQGAQMAAVQANTHAMLERLPVDLQKAHADLQNTLADVYQKAGLPPIMAFAMTPGQSSAEFAQGVLPNLKGNVGQNGFVPKYDDQFGTGKGNLNVYDINQMAQVKVGKQLVAGVVDKLRTVVDVAKANGADPSVIKQAEAQLSTLDKMPDTASLTGMDLYSMSLIENRLLGATQAAQAKLKVDTQTQTLENDKQRLVNEQNQIKVQNADVKLRQDQQQAQGMEQMLKTGINPYTKEQLNINNAPDTALVDDKGKFGTPGAVIPTDKAQFYKPTQTERVTADTARQVLAISTDLRQEIAAHPGIIGPLMGRSTKALASLGLGTERAQKLIDDVTFLQSAATKMHTSRFSNAILDKMGSMIDGKMNADQFKGGLDSIDEVASRYAQEDQMMSVGTYKAQKSQAAAPAGASAEVYAQDGKTLIGHAVGNKFVPLGK